MRLHASAEPLEGYVRPCAQRGDTPLTTGGRLTRDITYDGSSDYLLQTPAWSMTFDAAREFIPSDA